MLTSFDAQDVRSGDILHRDKLVYYSVKKIM